MVGRVHELSGHDWVQGDDHGSGKGPRVEVDGRWTAATAGEESLPVLFDEDQEMVGMGVRRDVGHELARDDQVAPYGRVRRHGLRMLMTCCRLKGFMIGASMT